ncbi:hypothetical protein JCM8547_002219 [Rhodosporidiobolus lusitaniae]
MQGPRFPSHYLGNSPDLVLATPDSPTKRAHPFERYPTSASPASASDRTSFNHLPPDPNGEAVAPANPEMTGEQAGRAGEAGQGKSGRGRDEGDDLEAGDESEGGLPPRAQRVLKGLKRHLAFVGPGVIASVAYLDPGNWATDLAAGSAYGYSHLFIIFLSGMIALLFQILSARLGCVSDYDLATHCRFALYDRPGRFKLFYRYGLLWPLYLLAESGIIFTDLAELLGSAIAINLLIPAIPLWAAVLLTSLDVFLVLLLFSQYPARTVTTSMRCFELLIGLLVLTVLGSFVALLVKVSPVWKDVFRGYVPSSGIVRGGGIYIAVGIIGATVMPHAFFIGSKMATMRRLKPSDYGESDDSLASRDLDDFDLDHEMAKKPSSPSSQLASVSPSSSPAPRGRPRQPRSVSRHPFIPALHMPQPFSLDGVGLSLHSLSRARSRSNSPVPGEHAYPPSPRNGAGRRKADEISEVAALSEADDEELGDEKKLPSSSLSAPMDDLAAPSPLPSPSNKKRSRAGDRSRPSRPKPTLACIRAHLGHACWDIAGSLLGFAVVVNSSILILGSAVFYYGPYRSTNPDGVSDLFDAYELVKDYLGQAFAYLFAVALLAAGQSASLTVTLSGQIVSEGFINFRTKPWKRRLITRLLNIVPSLAVAAAVGRAGIDTLLIASQVALSIVLTFVLLPLIIFTSQHSVMAVPINPSKLPSPSPPQPAVVPSSPPFPPPPPKPLSARLSSLARTLNPFRRRRVPEGHISYASPVALVWLEAALYTMICCANVYALRDVTVNGA